MDIVQYPYWSYVISLNLLHYRFIEILAIYTFVYYKFKKKTNNKGLLQIGITSILYKLGIYELVPHAK